MSAPARPRSFFALVVLLSCISMMGALAIDAYLPSFAAIRSDLRISEALMQQSLGVFLLCFATMMLFYGTLSDALGRRPVVLWSLAIFALASAAAAFSPGIEVLLICRAVQGLAAGGGPVVARAVVRDRFSGAQAQRVMSYMTVVFGLAPALAPILGGWIQVHWGWRWVFGAMALFAAVLWLLCLRVLPESLPVQRRSPLQLRPMALQYVRALLQLRFMLLVGAVATCFGGFALYIGSASHFVMDVLHLGETGFGWLFVPMIGGTATGAMLAARLAHRLPRRRFVQLAFALMALGALCNLLYHALAGAAPRLPWAVLPLMLYAFGSAFLMPALTMSAMDCLPRNQGLASSLQSFVQMAFFGLLAGFIAPMLFGSGLRLAWGMAACLSLSALLCVLYARSAKRTDV